MIRVEGGKTSGVSLPVFCDGEASGDNLSSLEGDQALPREGSQRCLHGCFLKLLI